MKTSIAVKQLSVRYHNEKALDTITLRLPKEELVGIIGPNGAGKSTFIKVVMGMIPKQSGSISILDESINKVRKKIAYVPQRNHIDMDFPVLVEDVVLMGRYPHISWWGRPKKRDRQLALHCLEKVGMIDFRKRQIGELSGGQQQRVFIARALAQEAQLFFLDEPFAGIDMTSEQIIFQLLKELKNEGKTIFVVHHDLSKVTDYFDQLIMLNKKLIAYGKTEDVFLLENLERAYEGKAAFVSNGSFGSMVVSN
ncbi:metal ABC transporter ATP-binding protein [Halalkalibacter sp. APA_J-10(15)]|uniref:metal ABC transporter ATP-binding protein n=1 Tax=Halalkalibacter sp. APA_J-10(15) TaxID=2933805 RepID=UPI001FF6710F|nr:metal ABC transporter ATP-binding protein [Halalkalibacter sp. APA_J-10(15)]MCK0472539.1 metal ABC transporter ATP-binding protein [Halalkalibacter sp. APA_J-10(15)]